MNTQAKTHTYTEPDSDKGFKGPMTGARLMEIMWERCAHTFTQDELASIAGGVSNAVYGLKNLSEAVQSIGALVCTDHGLGDVRCGALDDSSFLLGTIGEQIESLSAVIDVGNYAYDRMIYRDRYARVDKLKKSAAP